MRVMLKGGNDASIAAYAGPAGELVVNTNEYDVSAMDGVTPGGFPLSKIVDAYTVDAPVITSPLPGSVMSLVKLILSTVPFSGDGLHISTTWEIATDSGFSNVIYTDDSTEALTRLYLPRDVQSLSPSTEHYVRCKHISSAAGTSEWSPAVNFTTGEHYPSTLNDKLTPADGDSVDLFGIRIALSGDGLTLGVCASSDTNENGYNSGAGYIYKKNTDTGDWVAVQKLLPSDGESGDGFGIGVALSHDGTTVAFSSRYTGNIYPNSGAVYVYTLIGGVWTEQQKLTASAEQDTALFGYQQIDMSADGNTLLIGSPWHNVSGSVSSGKAYIFKRVSDVWSEFQAISPAVSEVDGNYGWGVAISPDATLLVVGALRFDAGGIAANGNAFVYDLDISSGLYLETQILIPSHLSIEQRFGTNVTISADRSTIAVCAAQPNFSGVLDGAVYVFVYSNGTWVEQAILVGSDTVDSEFFGTNVKLTDDGNIAVIGAYLEDNLNGIDSGAVYVLTRSGTVWSEVKKIIVSNGSAGSRLGVSIDISDDGIALAAGAYTDNNDGVTSGSVYLYG